MPDDAASARSNVPSEPERCANCGAEGLAEYCGQCGERRLHRDQWKLRAVVAETFDEVTDLDHSKLWQTFSNLVRRPGFLTKEYWRGRRKSFLGPVKVYLVLFALNLLAFSIYRPTSAMDIETMAASDPKGYYAGLIDRTVHASNLPRPIAVSEINSHWQNYVSLSQLLFPICVALVLKLLFLRQAKFYAEHLIFALHALTFVQLLGLLFWPLYIPVGVKLTALFLGLTTVQMVWTLVYVIYAVRRAYESSWPMSIVKGTVAYLAYFLVFMGIQSGALFLALAAVRRG